ncbi:FecR family protein [Pedobacter nyackensis]|uniref:FecR family protein n=1 Tax=Pedobacter nyackensis TaxID=475255 RepID=A0A1W2F5K9_9SPHI|nr:FecR family protein [Pedobacter nyackensis]SMD17197.1 FecR family protein [Pedobacter nyackensis]
MDIEELKYLLKKYNDQTATPEEIRIVEDWYESVNGEVPNFSLDELANFKANIYANVEANMMNTAKDGDKKNTFKIYRHYFAKAAILIGALLGIVYLFFVNPNRSAKSSLTANHEIKPGGNNAILKLANGTSVVLNDDITGQISNQQGVEVTKTKSGELVYSIIDQPGANVALMNTVTTPRGGQYHLILADKTEVWLNSGSSITFPAVFCGKDRKVAVTGEAYFEVAKNKLKPFIVSTKGSEVTVLGTHFNINAYDDEDAELTTLLEGSVSVKRNNQCLLLKPGQQASITRNSNLINMKEIEDPNVLVAWKDGYFQFDNADVAAVMRQISRWYNTEIQYNGSVPVKQYIGRIPRTVSAKELVEMLSYSGIHCTIEKNKIIVNPK